MNFYEMDKLVSNEKLVKRFVEAVTGLETVPTSYSPGVQTLYHGFPGEEKFQNSRNKGVLQKNDPLNQYKTENNYFNIVWITGMWSGAVPGTGRYSELLKPLGYNVKIIRTLSDMKTAGLGRIVRHIPIQAVKNIHSRWAAAHVSRNQDKISQELDAEPDLIIGSSQGGAIALSIADKYKDTPMFLLCPAWKIFNVNPTYVHPSSVIIHGIYDIEVPFQDSQELAQKFNITLIPTKDGHIVKQGMSVLISHLYNMATSLNRKKKTKEQESELAQECVVNLWFA